MRRKEFRDLINPYSTHRSPPVRRMPISISDHMGGIKPSVLFGEHAG